MQESRVGVSKNLCAYCLATAVEQSGLAPWCTAMHLHKQRLLLKVSRARISLLCVQLRSQSGKGPVQTNSWQSITTFPSRLMKPSNSHFVFGLLIVDPSISTHFVSCLGVFSIGGQFASGSVVGSGDFICQQNQILRALIQNELGFVFLA